MLRISLYFTQLAELIKDNGSGAVDEYSIVDCRYPYEYEGGHIQRAQNIWEKSVLSDRFFSKPQYTAEPRRRIIIFHCEFSSKRGPDMYVLFSCKFQCVRHSMIVRDAWELLSFSSAFVVYIYRSRFMRQTDRKKNDMAFPKLYYPELYLLDGGYKAFYEKFPVSIITVPLPLVCDGITPNLAGCFFSALIIIITIDYHKHLPPFLPLPPPLPPSPVSSPGAV